MVKKHWIDEVRLRRTLTEYKESAVQALTPRTIDHIYSFSETMRTRGGNSHRICLTVLFMLWAMTMSLS